MEIERATFSKCATFKIEPEEVKGSCTCTAYIYVVVAIKTYVPLGFMGILPVYCTLTEKHFIISKNFYISSWYERILNDLCLSKSFSS